MLSLALLLTSTTFTSLHSQNLNMVPAFAYYDSTDIDSRVPYRVFHSLTSVSTLMTALTLLSSYSKLEQGKKKATIKEI